MAEMVSVTQKRNELMDLLKRSEGQIRMALPKHMTPERMIRVAVTAYSRTPALQQCSTLSIASCVVQASELGLELTGPLGQAYLVPYYNSNTKSKEAQFQIGYRGMMDLAFRSGRVESIQPRSVYKNDKFVFCYGTKPKIEHVPADHPEGDPTWYYAVAFMKGGGCDFEVMSDAQIERHRKQFSKQKDTEYNPWNTSREAMSLKTVIRRLCKRLPASVELTKAVMIDEYNEAGIPVDMPNLGGDGADTVITNGAAAEAKEKLSPRLSQEQKDKLEILFKEMNAPQEQVKKWCEEVGAGGIAKLTQEQATTLINDLEKMKADLGAA